MNVVTDVTQPDPWISFVARPDCTASWSAGGASVFWPCDARDMQDPSLTFPTTDRYDFGTYEQDAWDATSLGDDAGNWGLSRERSCTCSS